MVKAQAIVANKIIVRNFSRDMDRWAKAHLVVGNPEYYQRERMGFWTGDTDEEIRLYEHKYVGDDYCLILPFGVIKDFYIAFHNECVFLPRFRPIKRLEYNSGVNLYSYQERAVEAILKAKNGVVVMPCGAGKTQTGLEAIARLGGRTLWLTHTQDLLNQSMNRAKSIFDLEADAYGTITEGKVNIGRMITFATVQTMVKINLQEYIDAFDVIVVDECHKAIGAPSRCMMFYKVLCALNARYKIGLTATPERADGLEDCMYSLLGSKIIEIDRKEVASRTCQVNVKFVDTGYIPDEEGILDTDGTILYSKLIDDLVDNEDRFAVVMRELEKIPEGSATLVLANRVRYCQKLHEAYKGKSICLSGAGTSKKAKEARKTALCDLNEGKIDCIFATYQLAKEGLDVPNLRFLLMATPEKDKTTVTQSAGRVARTAEGKEFGTIIDFVDDFSMYKKWRSIRKRIYDDLGYSIIFL